MGNAPSRAPRRRVDGVLLLDKPVGRSSNAALQRTKWLYRAEKAGHTGTLDPLASGLLPIVFGEAAKFSHFLLEADKGYRARVRFGERTGTGDAEGAVLERAPVAVDRAALEHELSAMRGEQWQTPPRHAALKHAGRPYYDYARTGEEPPREPRRVRLDELRLVEWQPPDADIELTCSKGTYVRVFAEDLGRALGSVAHLAGLRRTRTGGFGIEAAVDLDALEAMSSAERDARLLPVAALVAHLPACRLDATDTVRLQQGQRVRQAGLSGSADVACFDASGELIGVAAAQQGELVARRLRSQA